MLGVYSIVALKDGRIVGPAYGERIERVLCDEQCHEKLIVDQQHPFEYYEFYYSGKSIKKWVLNENNTLSQGIDLMTIQILNAQYLSKTDFACYTTMTDNSVTYTQLTASYNDDMETLSIEDPYGFQINVFNLQAIYFGFSEQDSNQCNNYKDDFYLFKEIPDLNTTSIWNEPMVGIKHQNTSGHDLPWMSMSLQYFNTSSSQTSATGMYVDITWSNNK
jgi:hypothetical protein